jgi:hypothetical protein
MPDGDAMALRSHLKSGSLLCATALLMACAVEPTTPAALSCTQLEEEIRATDDARRLALEKREDPWKFVTPFAVRGVHVAAQSAVEDADAWLASLQEEARRKHCAPSAPGTGSRDVLARRRPNTDANPTLR